MWFANRPDSHLKKFSRVFSRKHEPQSGR
ncbi:DUF1661 domain-containing protein [Porphyromonas gingivalis]|nr:DUF1661 domain-containing protein [Porphyromonas gingivalis]MCE8180837.1 DUF1661 domain-containing protein [Porphyromonas gingivalis]